MSKITQGQTVTFHCSTFLEDGTSLDAPNDRKPFVVKVGDSDDGDCFRRTINDALVGMTIDDRKRLKVPPERAFGKFDETKVYKIAVEEGCRYELGEVVDLKVSVGAGTRTASGVITKVAEDFLDVDTNHPLAGQTLLVKIRIVAIRG